MILQSDEIHERVVDIVTRESQNAKDWPTSWLSLYEQVLIEFSMPEEV